MKNNEIGSKRGRTLCGARKILEARVEIECADRTGAIEFWS